MSRAHALAPPAHRFTRWQGALAAIVCGLWWAWFSGPQLTIAAGNERLLAAFSVDEVIQVNLLDNALARDTIAIAFGSYGHFTFNLAFAVLYALAPFGVGGEAAILVVLRAVSLAATWLTVVFMFVWLTRRGLRAGAVVAVAALIVSPPIGVWASIVHPDALQVLLVALTIAAVARLEEEDGWRPAALAGAAAGLAFATKYAGVLFLPIIAAYAIVRADRSRAQLDAASSGAVVLMLRVVVALAALAALGGAWLMQPDVAARYLTHDGSLPPGLDAAWFARLRAVALGIAAAGALAAATPWPWRGLARQPLAVAVIRDLAAAGAAFLLAFTIVSPFSWWKLEFVKGILYVQDAIGPVARSSFLDAIARWLQVSTQLGLLLTAGGLAGAAIAFLTRTAWRGPASAPFRAALAWVVFAGAVIVVQTGSVRGHYLLPLAPGLAVLLAVGVESLARSRAALIAALAACASLAAVDLRASLFSRAERLSFVTSSPEVQLANELASNLPHEAKVLADTPAYVPPEFSNLTATWGGSLDQLRSVDPDVVVVHRVVRQMYGACDAGTERTRQSCAASAEYYRCLENGSCGYGLWRDFEQVKAYRRN